MKGHVKEIIEVRIQSQVQRFYGIIYLLVNGLFKIILFYVLGRY